MPEDNVRDLFIIGGGINGVGIARDAAGRGYSVTLAEMNDFASGTSSAATKLIHGGLRYLEHYKFRLVREALMEREILWAMAPHIIWPMRFVLPYHKGGIRPAWLIRLGLFLYDNIGGRKLLPPTRSVNMLTDPMGKVLKPLFSKAFEYSDGWVDDARMVVLNAKDAHNKGAEILARNKVIALREIDDIWHVDVKDQFNNQIRTVKARMVVNAAGPWVDDVLNNSLTDKKSHNIRLVQGSHIIVKKKFDDTRAYFFQNPDNRIIFAIPYETDFTLIGTTDRDYEGDPANVKITEEEIDYLCNAASEYFKEPVRPKDIVWSYSGVRPLFDDGASQAQEATRDYVLKVEHPYSKAPLLNVFGGKLTTYRRLAEHALEKINQNISIKGAPWTASSTLPGGNFPATRYDEEVSKLIQKHQFLNERHAKRLVRLYGTYATKIIQNAENYDALGEHFGGDLYAAEITYLINHEWARTSEDVLWRRTKQGLHLTQPQIQRVTEYMTSENLPANKDE